MSKYTAEQVIHAADLEQARYDGDLIISRYLRDYAALLRERESVKPVAWLDMGKGEAQLVFSKKAQSNRAAKKEAIRLFESIPEGYHPLFLHPLMQSAKAAVTDEMVFIAIYGYDSASPSFHPSIKGMRAALEAVAPMLASETSDELKEWEEFGRQIEKRLRYNPWGFKGSYPEIIDQVMTMASARVPDGWRQTLLECISVLDISTGDTDPNTSDEEMRDEYPEVWVMQKLSELLAAATKPETKE